MDRSDLFRPREPRRPLFVSVATDPPLLECWSENVSSRGIALVGRVAAGDATSVGAPLAVRFTLPDLSDVEAAGSVAWLRKTGIDQVALGVEFRDVPALSAERLARFLAAFRFRVFVVGADPAQRALFAEAVEDLITVEYVDLEAQVPRFDVAAVALCGRLPSHAAAQPGVIDVDPPHIVLGDWAASELLPLFQTRRIAYALPATATADAVRSVLFEACREGAMRSELRLTTLRFARELHALSTTRGGRRENKDLVATSPVMNELLEQIAIVAPKKVVVLVEGETGTGKELVARTLHMQSGRAGRPFVVQDCGTLTETLLDSELFGHVRGAFTGAHADHPGIFVVADGGTVFLDEIENTTPAMQAKLLRVIETGEIRPVGGSRSRVVDVRVVAATNMSLRDAVKAGRFRADLYYRLSVFPLTIPPLRARGADIALLAQHHAAAAADAHNLAAPSISPAALDAIVRYDWPGNVRQLKNAMERAVLLSAGRAIDVGDLPPDVRGGDAGKSASLDEKLRSYERELIVAALAESGGVLSRAATILRANRVTLARRARALGVAT